MTRRDDRRTPEAQQHRKLYDSRKYRNGRKNYLTEHPLCAWCLLKGTYATATELHHKIRHEGNEVLFFDVQNWCGLCKLCHDSAAQQIERIGYSTEIGPDGWPVDDNHPANRC